MSLLLRKGGARRTISGGSLISAFAISEGANHILSYFFTNFQPFSFERTSSHSAGSASRFQSLLLVTSDSIAKIKYHLWTGTFGAAIFNILICTHNGSQQQVLYDRPTRAIFIFSLQARLGRFLEICTMILAPGASLSYPPVTSLPASSSEPHLCFGNNTASALSSLGFCVCGPPLIQPNI